MSLNKKWKLVCRNEDLNYAKESSKVEICEVHLVLDIELTA